MTFTRKYVLIAMGCNEIKAFFNTYQDAKEHLDRLNNTYPYMYSSLKIFKST